MTMVREIVLDTETTGTDAKGGDRIVEIGCVELLNHIRTGRTFHRFINPQRAVSEGAFAVHGLSDKFLADKPTFSGVIDEFLEFCGDGRMVIHNAAFDIGFLNMEFARLKPSAPEPIALEIVIDTLILARRKHPGASNSLDALCHRYGIDNAKRTKHGALLDAEILADVYVELLGGKQTKLGLADTSEEPTHSASAKPQVVLSTAIEKFVGAMQNRLSEIELTRHSQFIKTLKGDVIWGDYNQNREVDGKASDE